MNNKQKFYDRYDEINQLMKISNNFILFKNLNSISNRKAIYTNTPDLRNRLGKNNLESLKKENINDYYIMKENEIYNKMLKGVKSQQSQSNLMKQINYKKLENHRKQNRSIQDKLLQIENEKYKKRINMQKGVINTKNTGEDYKNYQKMIRRLRKVKDERVVLPPISNIIANRVSTAKRRVLERSKTAKSRYITTVDDSKEEKKKEGGEFRVSRELIENSSGFIFKLKIYFL